MKNEKIALMYTGGVDTTYIALHLIKKFNKVHLLTFCNGVCVRVKSSKIHARLLKKKFSSEKIEHHILPACKIFKRIRNGMLKDILDYHSPLLFDLCCKLSMEIATIIYCKSKGIRYVTDGNNPKTQGEIFLQQEEYMEESVRFFSKFGINYIHPVKSKNSRKNMIEELASFGFKKSKKMLEYFDITSQLFTQPFCMWSPIPFLFTSFLRKIPIIQYFNLALNEAVEYRLKKEKVGEDIIKQKEASNLSY